YVGGTSANGFLTASIASGIVRIQPGPTVPANVKAEATKLENDFLTQSLVISFQTDPKTNTPVCFEQTTPVGQCEDGSSGSTAARPNYLPPELADSRQQTTEFRSRARLRIGYYDGVAIAAGLV